MKSKIISSQHYLDDAIVESKVSAEDFEVFVSPEFDFEGVLVRVVLDGHHSLEAAKIAGVDPVFVEMDRCDHDAIALLDGTAEGVEAFTDATWMGGDYYDVMTGGDVW